MTRLYSVVESIKMITSDIRAYFIIFPFPHLTRCSRKRQKSPFYICFVFIFFYVTSPHKNITTFSSQVWRKNSDYAEKKLNDNFILYGRVWSGHTAQIQSSLGKSHVGINWMESKIVFDKRIRTFSITVRDAPLCSVNELLLYRRLFEKSVYYQTDLNRYLII